jgi:acid stress-induced BolA-like protein IbaG/YrbA
MDKQTVLSRIADGLPGTTTTVEGEDCSFAVAVVSPAFKGMRPLARQQAVLRLFAPELSSGELHALSVVAKTPEELADSLVSIKIGA